ncbi:MAG: NAD-dependent epimerase/dehydratase family protein, partial [Nitrospira sp.]|nr:NAD-dependent epimerase/dehydratase family protein [Nitrospira sp.]
MAKRSNRPILVTGGCGFIGTNLVAELLAKEYQVRILDNLSVTSQP